MTTDFRGNGYSKNRIICDCAGEPTHAITTLLSNSILVLFMLPKRVNTEVVRYFYVTCHGVCHVILERDDPFQSYPVLKIDSTVN